MRGLPSFISQGRDEVGYEGKQKRELLHRSGGGRGVPRLWSRSSRGYCGVVWEGAWEKDGK